jgi:hypothetical protein
MKGGNLVVVVVVVVTTVVWVAGAKENCPSVLSAPNCAILEVGRSLLRLSSSPVGVENFAVKGDLMVSFGVVL